MKNSRPMKLSNSKTSENGSKAMANQSFSEKCVFLISPYSGVIQPKLTINQPNDIYEKEADDVADEVIHMTSSDIQTKPLSVSGVQRKCAHCGEEERNMQRKGFNNETTTANSELENYVGNLNSGGQSLPEDVRSFYEPRLGYDFSSVKVHTHSVAAKSAQSINALAYTNGNNIVFNEGQYSPTTDSGKRLPAHELTHTIQQNSSIQKQAVQRQELPPIQGGINLTFGENGSVDVTAYGPTNTPVISSPTIGIRRDANGDYHVLVGGRDKVVPIDQIPSILRGAMGGGGSGAGSRPQSRYRIPRCSSLRVPDGSRFMNFMEYRISQSIAPELFPFTEELYNTYIDIICTSAIQAPAASQPSEYGDFPESPLPEGEEYA